MDRIGRLDAKSNYLETSDERGMFDDYLQEITSCQSDTEYVTILQRPCASRTIEHGIHCSEESIAFSCGIFDVGADDGPDLVSHLRGNMGSTRRISLVTRGILIGEAYCCIHHRTSVRYVLLSLTTCCSDRYLLHQ